jgi:hypothetical protein
VTNVTWPRARVRGEIAVREGLQPRRVGLG